MKSPSVTSLKKYLSGLKKMKKKYVTSELLSREIGVYPEVINGDLLFFDPLVSIDYKYNLMDLVEPIEEFIGKPKTPKKKRAAAKPVVKKEPLPFDSIGDFFYQKMTIGGVVDRNVDLSDQDLRDLKKLINCEQASRKPVKKKGK